MYKNVYKIQNIIISKDFFSCNVILRFTPKYNISTDHIHSCIILCYMCFKTVFENYMAILKIYFWDCILIITFLPSPSSLQSPPPCFFLLSFKFMASFLSVVLHEFMYLYWGNGAIIAEDEGREGGKITTWMTEKLHGIILQAITFKKCNSVNA